MIFSMQSHVSFHGSTTRNCAQTKPTHLRTRVPESHPDRRGGRQGRGAGGSCGPVCSWPGTTSAWFLDVEGAVRLRKPSAANSPPTLTAVRLGHKLTCETALGFLADYYACAERPYRLPGVAGAGGQRQVQPFTTPGPLQIWDWKDIVCPYR